MQAFTDRASLAAAADEEKTNEDKPWPSGRERANKIKKSILKKNSYPLAHGVCL